MMNDFEKKLVGFADGYDMLPRGGRILCAVSGGADSVSMLLALCAVSREREISISVAHFNHLLRGDESDGDEIFVRALCRRLCVPFTAGRGDVKGEAEKCGESTETAARRMRYAFLEQAADGALIATAHTADDNAETVIFNLVRGAGTRGLAGIPPRRGNIIRPLLCVTRTEVEEYLRLRGEAHREDSTNESDDYTRNIIRHRVMPVLREINPRAAENASRLSALLRADDEYLCSEAHRFLIDNRDGESVPARELSLLPKPVASRAVREICGAGMAMAHTEAVLALAKSSIPSAETDIPGLTVRREYDRLIFGGERAESFSPAVLSEGDSTVISGNICVSCEKRVFSSKIHKSFNTFIFKYADICGKIIVRPRRTGDRIKIGRGRTKTLKKLFIEKKIPASMRESIPVFEDEKGILAVGEVGQSVRSCCFEGDEVLIIKIGELKENE